MTVQKRCQADLPLSRLKELLSYDPDTGAFTMIVGRGNRMAGSRAGYFNNAGYELIWIDGKWFLAHRLAVYYATGTWPTIEVDHINGNPSDNRLCNLRLATRSENMRNVAHGKGWHFHKGANKWQALIRVNKKRVYLGRYDNEDEAKAAYLRAVNKYHGEFSPFISRGAD